MSTARATAALLAIAAAVGAIAFLLIPNPPARADTPAAPAQERTATLSGLHGTAAGADLAVLDAASPEALTTDQTAQVFAAADRVCEGLTAGVPEGFMVRTVAADAGLALPAAHAFVEAAITRCASLR